MKLPPNAKRVFKGQIFNVFQWPQKLYDGTSATFEGLKRPDTIQIIPTARDKIYLSWESQPTKSHSFKLLGGRAESNEQPLVTAKRELLEESGLESQDWELFKVYEFEGKIEWAIHLYIARSCRKVAKPHLDPGEKIDVKEVSFDQFLDIVSSEDFHDMPIANDILRMRLNKEKLEEFRMKLFK